MICIAPNAPFLLVCRMNEFCSTITAMVSHCQQQMGKCGSSIARLPSTYRSQSMTYRHGWGSQPYMFSTAHRLGLCWIVSCRQKRRTSTLMVVVPAMARLCLQAQPMPTAQVGRQFQIRAVRRKQLCSRLAGQLSSCLWMQIYVLTYSQHA